MEGVNENGNAAGCGFGGGGAVGCGTEYGYSNRVIDLGEGCLCIGDRGFGGGVDVSAGQADGNGKGSGLADGFGEEDGSGGYSECGES